MLRSQVLHDHQAPSVPQSLQFPFEIGLYGRSSLDPNIVLEHETREPSEEREQSNEIVDTRNLAEAFFDRTAARRCATAEAKSSKAEVQTRLPRLSEVDRVSIEEYLKESKREQSAITEKLIKEHETLFQQWMLYLCENFNLLFYGYGSKKQLIEDFVDQHLGDHCRLQVNGFNPTISVKQIFSSLCEGLDVDMKTAGSNYQDQVKLIQDSLSKQASPGVILIIHNIDGVGIRDTRSQLALSQLAQVPKIHLIASIDHIHAPLMWTEQQAVNFRWLWINATTYIPYSDEMVCQTNLLINRDSRAGADRHTLGSLRSVWASLAENARKMFAIIAQRHLKLSHERGYLGISFSQLYRLCRENFLANSEAALRAQLVEYRDHHLLVSKRSSDGTEYLTIKIRNDLLREFLATEGIAEELDFADGDDGCDC